MDYPDRDSIRDKGNLSEGSESSSSEAEDEEAFELTEDVERNFFKALSSLKKKDPQIYEKDTRFFGTKPELDESFVRDKRKKKSEIPLNVRKYETDILLNKGADISDEQDFDQKANFGDVKPLTYVQEQNQLKDSFKKVLNENSSDDEEEIGGLFQEHKKSKKEKEAEESEYKTWLKGQQCKIEDKDAENDMGYLHDYWNDPNLDEGEKFLRDYILNKKFLEESKPSTSSADLLNLEEDEKLLTEQTDFEHKYNFRFEEPDREFIKRYPRTMENSMRRKDERRKQKRQETAKRKKEEKELKKLELKKIKEQKYKEIKEKIAKLKNLTGNPELGFQDEDIEKDFDPEEHNLKMQKLFSEDFYNQEESDKPVFDDDEDLNLDSYGDDGYKEVETYCEDPDFIMDCDYDPEQAMLEKKKKSEAREKKKKKKSNKEVLEKSDDLDVDQLPVDETIQKELEDVHKYDCEDIIGDTPIRFKYREVVPNNYGLTIDEILAADDKELEKWCSIQRIAQVRPEEKELYDVEAYKRKAMNEELKRKILPSLYKNDAEKKSKRKKNKKKKPATVTSGSIQSTNQHKCSQKAEENFVRKVLSSPAIEIQKNKKRKKTIDEGNIKTNGETIETSTKNKVNETCTDNSIHENEEEEKMHKKKRIKLVNTSDCNGTEPTVQSSENHNKEAASKKKRKNKKKPSIMTSPATSETSKSQSNGSVERENIPKAASNKGKLFPGKVKLNSQKLRKTNEDKRNQNQKYNRQTNGQESRNKSAFYSDISDSRLKAYGIKPKLFKNKLKYGKNNDT
ncbi:protein KRI1 homolog [Nilaparvata lugens]|uniref:protein KRI1 homolog n=1 Tax=Nilaparvata lugens TaxID=108931 RepID=UPI00193CF402|nr:protein KRI1 homolog [Nilaparvata lugens]